MTVTILCGDVFEKLRELKSNSFDCVVTSPPYWGLRKYTTPGSPEERYEIGLEPTLGEHLAVMVDVFREVRRVLKAHGTVWLNYGDCYAAAPNGKSAAAYKADGSDDRTFRDKPFSTVGPILAPRTLVGGDAHNGSFGIDRDTHDLIRARSGPVLQPDTRGPQRSGAKEACRPDSGFTVRPGGFLKPKDLCMIPNRLAIALQDDGWWVRSEIVWNKTNPKPESISDRPAAVHEKIWLLAKSEEYFFNPEGLKEPVSGGAHARRKDKQYKPAKGSTAGQNRAGTWVETYTPELRNGRNVWTFSIEGCREAHFATFPQELASRCIRAGVPRFSCSFCGAALPQPACHGACQIVPPARGRVLDPFGGAGTVGLVAQKLGVDCTLIELNTEYVEITRRRLGLGAPDKPEVVAA